MASASGRLLLQARIFMRDISMLAPARHGRNWRGRSAADNIKADWGCKQAVITRQSLARSSVVVPLPLLVMAGLVPAIHMEQLLRRKTWMPGTSRDKPGHDDIGEPSIR